MLCDGPSRGLRLLRAAVAGLKSIIAFRPGRAAGRDISVWPRLAAIALPLTIASGCLHAAEIYVSTATDGTYRFATQALDATYRLVDAAPGLEQSASATNAKSQSTHLRSVIERVAARRGMPVHLLEAVVSVESGHDADAVSPKGALGAMQLMPATATRYGLRGRDWRDPERNIDAGARHLRELIDKHHGNVALALAAYNAGPGATKRYGGRIPPYSETMIYVAAVLARAAAASGGAL